MSQMSRDISVGAKLMSYVSEGDTITVTTRRTAEPFTVEIRETPDLTPVEDGEEGEVMGVDENNDLIGLYARVLDVGEMHADYDVYAVKIAEDSTEDLGEITRVEPEDEE